MSLPQRHCLILQGDNDWLIQQAQTLYQQADQNYRCWLSDCPDRPNDALSSQQALQQLGRDNLLIIFDGREHFSADALGALIGTLKAGGWILLLLHEHTERSRWLQRFLNVATKYPNIHCVRRGQTVPEIALSPLPTSLSPIAPTAEQEQAIHAVLRVVSGHRRRPLVITSDRGRGKTALLGMAAAELLRQGKKRILVTAPSIDNIQPLLQHAGFNLSGSKRQQYGLAWEQGKIDFIAPDALLEQTPETDLLIIDEAAAIPAQILEQMLTSYSRIVFSTTLHGYEGTGRGFAVRFRKTLDALTPNWRSVSLQQPVRWSVDDTLERFSFEALLLDAEPADEAVLSSVSSGSAMFDTVNAKTLAADETQLREMFGLMVLAHYRTRPSDLQMLLERDDITVAVLRAEGHIVATAWLLDEPPLEEDLARQVFEGRRRLKGRMLPQSLLAHAGLTDAGRYHYQRIIRIAVHPTLQGQGLGSQLLTVIQQMAESQCDLLGTSFAIEADVSRFWLHNAYQPVRLGQHQDQVSGSISLMMLKAVSSAGENLLQQAKLQLQHQWPFLLQTQLSELAPDLALLVWSALTTDKQPLNADVSQQVLSFAKAQRAYESSQFALSQWLHQQVSADELRQLNAEQQSLLMMLIGQQRTINEVAEKLGLTGKAEVIKKLRQAVSDCLSAVSSVDTR